MLLKPLLVLLAALPLGSGYVVSHMPRQRQLAWLEEMTDNICSTKPGALSHEMLERAPDLMHAWAHLDEKQKKRSGSPVCALRVESLVKRVVDERMAGNLDAAMTLAEYNCLLEGWARSGAGEAAAERCTQIVKEMQEHGDVQPDLSSFKAVLMAWKQSSRSKNAPTQAQRVLEWMVELCRTGENDQACPDADCFDIVMQIWSRSGRKEAPATAERLLYAMEALYEATQDAKLKPRTTSFNAVLAAWAKSHDPTAYKRVLAILGFMEKLSRNSDDTVPDQASYMTAIVALARSKEADPELAEKLLRRVEGIYLEDDDEIPEIRPDTVMYNSVIACWSRGKSEGNFRIAKSTLNRQVQTYRVTKDDRVKPDVFGFTSVMTACAMETKEKAKAFDVALATFQTLRRSEGFGAPNHVTYGTMLKCCAKLLPPNDPLRQKWVRKTWKSSVKNGCVGDMVLRQLREAAGPLYNELIMTTPDNNSIPLPPRAANLPAKWTRNVREQRSSHRKRPKKSRRTALV